MKIAVFHELHSGGARRAVNEFARELKKNHTVDLFIVDSNLEKEEKKAFTNIFIFPFNKKMWSGGNWRAKLYKDTIELFKLFRLHKKISTIIDKKGYDLVFVHPSQFTQAPFLLRFLKTKSIYYCEEPLRIVYEDSFVLDNKLSFIKRVYENMNRRIRKYIDSKNISYADVILANSKNTQKNILSAYRKKSTVIYLGVDTAMFHPLAGKKDTDILYIGAEDVTDGYFLLHEALRYINKKLKVIYHIPGKNWMKDEKAFAALYARSKIVVCLARKEPFGLIPLEAMACGVPVLAVNEGGYKETIVHGRTGYLVRRDAKYIARKLNYMVTSQQKLRQMSKNARKHVVHHWTWEKSVKHLEKILAEAL